MRKKNPLPPHKRIAEFRKGLGLSLEAFGKRIGVNSKGRMSDIERGARPCTPDQALAIESITGGQIDAAILNDVVAAARGAPEGRRVA